MINTHLMTIGGAVLSVAVAGLSAVDTVQTIATAQMITGTGSHSGFARAGEVTLVDWALHKRTDCPGWNSRAWSGPNGFRLIEEQMPTTLPRTDEPQVYQIQTLIPEMAPPGTLRLSIIGGYKCHVGGEHSFSLGPVEIEVEG